MLNKIFECKKLRSTKRAKMATLDFIQNKFILFKSISDKSMLIYLNFLFYRTGTVDFLHNDKEEPPSLLRY